MLESKQICCSHIYKKEKDILLVIHSDDYFQFLCGEEHDDEPELMKLKDVLEYDPSIEFILQLKKNHEAERLSIKDFWKIKYYGED